MGNAVGALDNAREATQDLADGASEAFARQRRQRGLRAAAQHLPLLSMTRRSARCTPLAHAEYLVCP